MVLVGPRLLPRAMYSILKQSSCRALYVAFCPHGTFSRSVESAGTDSVSRSAL